MSLPKQKQREIVLLLLYCQEQAPESEDKNLVNLISYELKVAKSHVNSAFFRYQQVKEHQIKIDDLITSASKTYQFQRIHLIERNILRLGLFEMLFDETIPAKVAIAEAMRLSKKFGTPASVAFVNAIMDHVYKGSHGESVDTEPNSSQIEELLKQEELAKEAFQNREGINHTDNSKE